MMTTNATNIVRRKVDAIGTCACVDLVHEALVFTHRKLAGACWTAKGRPEAEACSAIVADAIATLARGRTGPRVPEESGRLIGYGRMSILSCRVCGASPKPILFKSGRRRGEIKHRGVISCVELADRFVRIHGHITLGCCAGCFAAHAALLAAHLAGVRAEVPGSLSVPGRWERRRCTAVEMVIEQDAGGRR